MRRSKSSPAESLPPPSEWRANYVTPMRAGLQWELSWWNSQKSGIRNPVSRCVATANQRLRPLCHRGSTENTQLSKLPFSPWGGRWLLGRCWASNGYPGADNKFWQRWSTCNKENFAFIDVRTMPYFPSIIMSRKYTWTCPRLRLFISQDLLQGSVSRSCHRKVTVASLAAVIFLPLSRAPCSNTPGNSDLRMERIWISTDKTRQNGS